MGKHERKPLNPDLNHRPPSQISIDEGEFHDGHELNVVPLKTSTWKQRLSDCCYRLSNRTKVLLFTVLVIVGVVLASIALGFAARKPPPPPPGSSSSSSSGSDLIPTTTGKSGGTLVANPETRHDDILLQLSQITAPKDLTDDQAPQYEAYQWIIHHDPLKLQVDSPILQQRYAMAVIFFALNGKAWIVPEPWIEVAQSDDDFALQSSENVEANPECTWTGVDCDQDSKVTHLYLSEFGLEGSLPSEMFHLTNLEKLDLSNNQISGAVPPEIDQLKNLDMLMLDQNGLVGAIPDTLCTSAAWMTVDCDSVVCSCCANCDGTNSSDVASPIGGATAGDNQSRISTINKLIGPLSPDISNVGSPQNTAVNWILYGDDQKLSVKDASLVQRYVLAVLYYSLGGDSWATSSSWLTEQSECSYSGVVCNEFGDVTTIALINSGLVGTIPAELGLLNDLEVLELNDNQITGVIPVQLSKLENLQALMLQDNNLVGNVAAPICELRQGVLREFHTDCDSPDSGVACDCCTNCEPGLGSELNSTIATRSIGGDSGFGSANADAASVPMRVDYQKRFGFRGSEIAAVLEGISPEEIYVPGSKHSAAVEWIIKEDGRLLEHDDPMLEQRWVMALLYFALDGPNWNHQEWLTDESECSWYSVKCNGDGWVTELNLTATGLLGAVPDELAALTELETLDMHGNRLGGEAPEDLCDELEFAGDSLSVLIFDCMSPPLVDCDCCTPCDELGLSAGVPTEGHTDAAAIEPSGDSKAPVTQAGNPGASSVLAAAAAESVDYVTLYGERGGKIARILAGVSGEIYTPGSSSAAAAEWIIQEDAMGLEDTDANLVQRFVLALLYYHLDGANWVYQNFLTEASECEWDQIECNGNGEVTSITLTNAGLLGSVPEELAGIKTIKTIDLRGNHIGGESPEDFCLEEESSAYALETLIFDCLDPPLVSCDCCDDCDEPESSGGESHADAIDYDALFGHRGQKIAEELEKVSEDVYVRGSTAAAAAEWIIQEDPLAYSHDDQGLLQRFVLTMLYYALDGQNWVYTKFRTGDEECSWDEITCDADGQVTEVTLTNGGLMGLVPYELAALPNLKTIDLRGNRIEGEVPEDFCLIKESGPLETLIFDCMVPSLVECDCCTPCSR